MNIDNSFCVVSMDNCRDAIIRGNPRYPAVITVQVISGPVCRVSRNIDGLGCGQLDGRIVDNAVQVAQCDPGVRPVAALLLREPTVF